MNDQLRKLVEKSYELAMQSADEKNCFLAALHLARAWNWVRRATDEDSEAFRWKAKIETTGLLDRATSDIIAELNKAFEQWANFAADNQRVFRTDDYSFLQSLKHDLEIVEQLLKVKQPSIDGIDRSEFDRVFKAHLDIAPGLVRNDYGLGQQRDIGPFTVAKIFGATSPMAAFRHDRISVRTYVEGQLVSYFRPWDGDRPFENGQILIMCNGWPAHHVKWFEGDILAFWSRMTGHLRNCHLNDHAEVFSGDSRQLLMRFEAIKGETLHLSIPDAFGWSAPTDRVDFFMGMISAGLEFWDYCERTYIAASWLDDPQSALSNPRSETQKVFALAKELGLRVRAPDPKMPYVVWRDPQAHS